MYIFCSKWANVFLFLSFFFVRKLFLIKLILFFRSGFALRCVGILSLLACNKIFHIVRKVVLLGGSDAILSV